ncbi:helix-turn-helix domain-containing protein [Leptospira sp. 'Mane']|uniref:helix-turn-helix domain-containing protein n=1 Tax=Leptospira sp. 'Mane' TaxID=3387407 RepID=UPI00398B5FCF
MDATQRIKEIFSELKSQGWTQVQIATEIGKSQQTISRYISGEIAITESIGILLEEKFNYRKEWVIRGELPKKKDKDSILTEVSRISANGRNLEKIPEIRDMLNKIIKLKKEDYNTLIKVMKSLLKEN